MMFNGGHSRDSALVSEEILRCLAVELDNIVMVVQGRETDGSWDTVMSLTTMALHPLLHHLIIAV